jgi:hypothetical protein
VRAVTCERLELTGLMQPFDLEVFYGERVAVLGSNGSGKSHFLRLLAGDRGTSRTPVSWRLGAGVVPGLVRTRPTTPRALHGRTLVELLHRGDDAGGARAGRGRCGATSSTTAGDQRYETLSGGQQARFQILLLELSGCTLLLLDEPTDNLDLVSAEALEEGLGRLRRHGARRHARPLVRPRLRPLRGVRRRLHRTTPSARPHGAEPTTPRTTSTTTGRTVLVWNRTRCGHGSSTRSVTPSDSCPLRSRGRGAAPTHRWTV